MAEAAKDSGLSSWLGAQLYVFRGVHPWVMVFAVTFLSSMITEIVSNAATTLIILPVLNELAQKTQLNPLYLLLPATISSSYAFLLPIATPSNAIVFSAARMRGSDMIRVGVVLNVLCVLVLNVMINTLGVTTLDLHTMPAWANSTLP